MAWAYPETATKTLNFGDIPTDLTIHEPFDMWLVARDEKLVCKIINQGIDAHLEAVHATDHGVTDGNHHIAINDPASMRCFLRRLMEEGSDRAADLASCIMGKLDYEWV